MATRNDDTGSRLWRGMRALLFGDDGETTLREEIEDAIDEAEETRPIAGDLTPVERQMLRNLLHFGDETAGDICVTRGDIVSVPSTISFDDLVKAFAEAEHSRLPVYGESLEEIVGEIEDEHDIEAAGLLTRLDDGVWEADARIELEELAEAVDARLVWEEDEVDTLGGLVFLLAGHIPKRGECVTHPSGWRLEAVDSDPRRILRVRLHAPETEEKA